MLIQEICAKGSVEWHPLLSYLVSPNRMLLSNGVHSWTSSLSQRTPLTKSFILSLFRVLQWPLLTNEFHQVIPLDYFNVPH